MVALSALVTQKQVDLYEFKASLVTIVSSRQIKAIEQDLITKTLQQTNKNLNGDFTETGEILFGTGETDIETARDSNVLSVR